MFDSSKYNEIAKVAKDCNATIVAVTKTKPIADILEAYELGIRAFGENKVQELCNKYEQLPKDIHWHLIGHLQSNKVKYIAPFITLIHSIDSYKLLEIVNKEASKHRRVIQVLLQVHIATEEEKFGFDDKELFAFLDEGKYQNLSHVVICGLMGMATNTEDEEAVSSEFNILNSLFNKIKNTYFKNNDTFEILSMGMSGDYDIALKAGSNMLRIGSILFGNR
jgi:pyridoxal phosphate enzyme (YggS family)